MRRERLHNKQPTVRRNISITDQDLALAKALGDGNVSHGIKIALRVTHNIDKQEIELENLADDA